MAKYRPNVAALILNKKGKLLVCERMHVNGGWQFPQGGVDEGETAIEALRREVLEEVGIHPESYEIVDSKDGYKYDYPAEKSNKKGYKGQKQTYFLCQLIEKVDVNLEYHSKEFQDYKWIKKKKYKRKWVPKFKLAVYEQVMMDFFGKELKD